MNFQRMTNDRQLVGICLLALVHEVGVGFLEPVFKHTANIGGKTTQTWLDRAANNRIVNGALWFLQKKFVYITKRLDIFMYIL
jgi:hypothetical protein